MIPGNKLALDPRGVVAPSAEPRHSDELAQRVRDTDQLCSRLDGCDDVVDILAILASSSGRETRGVRRGKDACAVFAASQVCPIDRGKIRTRHLFIP